MSEFSVLAQLAIFAVSSWIFFALGVRHGTVMCRRQIQHLLIEMHRLAPPDLQGLLKGFNKCWDETE